MLPLRCIEDAPAYLLRHSKEMPNGCRLWQRGTTRAGYGTLTFDGEHCYAHRLAYEVFVGPIPISLMVCHTCDTPGCLNPLHLFVGTARDNTHDALHKGRLWKQPLTLKRLWRERGDEFRGERNPASKLKVEQVLEIRRLHKEEGWGHKRLRKRFNVSYGVVQRILNRTAWRHV